jgi:hypothetical protein
MLSTPGSPRKITKSGAATNQLNLACKAAELADFPHPQVRIPVPSAPKGPCDVWIVPTSTGRWWLDVQPLGQQRFRVPPAPGSLGEELMDHLKVKFDAAYLAAESANGVGTGVDDDADTDDDDDDVADDAAVDDEDA